MWCASLNTNSNILVLAVFSYGSKIYFWSRCIWHWFQISSFSSLWMYVELAGGNIFTWFGSRCPGLSSLGDTGRKANIFLSTNIFILKFGATFMSVLALVCMQHVNRFSLKIYSQTNALYFEERWKCWSWFNFSQLWRHRLLGPVVGGRKW